MRGTVSSTTAEVYMQPHKHTAIPMTRHLQDILEQCVDDVYSILKRSYLEKRFPSRQESSSNGELAMLDTSLKWNNGNISVLVHRNTTHDQYLPYSTHSVVAPLFNRVYSIITNKDDLYKKNARIKQVLKENRYQESISKTFKRITNNHSFSQSQQQRQATDIQKEEVRRSINLAYVEGTSEKLWAVLKSHIIRSTFYTESILHELFCKPKDQAATEDQNNIVYEINYSNYESVYISESQRSLKSRSDERKSSVRNRDFEKTKLQNIVEKQITT